MVPGKPGDLAAAAAAAAAGKIPQKSRISKESEYLPMFQRPHGAG